MAQTVIGIFENENEAQKAVENLISKGFNREDVDIAAGSKLKPNMDEHSESFGDSISNFFGSLFSGDDDRSKNYTNAARNGTTVTVHARSENEAESAADILDECGAVNVDDNTSNHRSGSDFTDTNDTSARSIPVIEENLEIGKREVEGGGTRIKSRIVEKPVEESIRLRSETVNMERNPVNRQATDADFNTFKEGTIEMTEHKEVPVVDKQAWVKEEVSLNKDVEEREETIRDTVRSTEVDVENISDKDQSNSSRSNSLTDDDDDEFDDDNSHNRNRSV